MVGCTQYLSVRRVLNGMGALPIESMPPARLERNCVKPLATAHRVARSGSLRDGECDKSEPRGNA
jgi:hypothetical protein